MSINTWTSVGLGRQWTCCGGCINSKKNYMCKSLQKNPQNKQKTPHNKPLCHMVQATMPDQSGQKVPTKAQSRYSQISCDGHDRHFTPRIPRSPNLNTSHESQGFERDLQNQSMKWFILGHVSLRQGDTWERRAVCSELVKAETFGLCTTSLWHAHLQKGDQLINMSSI